MLIDRRTTLLGGIAALTIPTGIVGAAAARVRPVAAAQRAGWLDVRNFGARGDGVKIDTPAVNRAIEAAAKAGGGTVYFPAGTYACHTIRLKSNVTLYLEQGSVILAAPTPIEGTSATTKMKASP